MVHGVGICPRVFCVEGARWKQVSRRILVSSTRSGLLSPPRTWMLLDGLGTGWLKVSANNLLMVQCFGSQQKQHEDGYNNNKFNQ